MPNGALFPVPMASAEDVIARAPRRLIDLRSPSEFEEDHLPGAQSAPLFDDLERALIGTLYTQRSPEAAFEEGRARTRAKIADFSAHLAEQCGWHLPRVDLEQRVERMTAAGIASLERELTAVPSPCPADAAVLYCWRGGLRSRAVIAFLRGLGFADALGIQGGYKAYRRCVRERVLAWQAPPSVVLRGLTGVGKTLVLRELAARRPEWVLDLEALAGHRSSILGMVGLEPASQKLFESRLAQRLALGFGASCVVEGESRKVGDLVLPEPVWRAIDGGLALELVTDTPHRVRVLCEDYLASARSRAELARQLPFIEQRLGPRWDGELVGLLERGREAELVELLLQRYYDPLYTHSERGRSYAARIDSSDPRAAAAEIEAWVLRHEARAASASPFPPAQRVPAPRSRAAADL